MIDATQAIAFEEPRLATRQETAAREARFAGLVERQSRFVFRVAYSLLRNSHDAEDAVQETFLKLYRTGAWEAIENERGFLARAAWRIAVDKLRRGRRATIPPGCMRSRHGGPAVAPRGNGRTGRLGHSGWVWRVAPTPGSHLPGALLARPAPRRDAQLGLRKPGGSRDGREPERLRKRGGAVHRARSGRRRGGRSLRVAGASVTAQSTVNWRRAQRQHRAGSAAPHAGTGGLRGTRPRDSGPGPGIFSE